MMARIVGERCSLPYIACAAFEVRNGIEDAHDGLVKDVRRRICTLGARQRQAPPPRFERCARFCARPIHLRGQRGFRSASPPISACRPPLGPVGMHPARVTAACSSPFFSRFSLLSRTRADARHGACARPHCAARSAAHRAPLSDARVGGADLQARARGDALLAPLCQAAAAPHDRGRHHLLPVRAAVRGCTLRGLGCGLGGLRAGVLHSLRARSLALAPIRAPRPSAPCGTPPRGTPPRCAPAIPMLWRTRPCSPDSRAIDALRSATDLALAARLFSSRKDALVDDGSGGVASAERMAKLGAALSVRTGGGGASCGATPGSRRGSVVSRRGSVVGASSRRNSQERFAGPFPLGPTPQPRRDSWQPLPTRGPWPSSLAAELTSAPLGGGAALAVAQMGAPFGAAASESEQPAAVQSPQRQHPGQHQLHRSASQQLGSVAEQPEAAVLQRRQGVRKTVRVEG